MKKNFTLFFLLITSGIHFAIAQHINQVQPYSKIRNLKIESIAEVVMPAYDFSSLLSRSEQRIKEGNFPITDKLFETNYTTENSGTWTTLENGDKLWRLKITSHSAERTALYFKNFHIPEGGALFVYNQDYSKVLGSYSSDNNENADNNDGVFATDYIDGESQFVEYYQPAEVTENASIEISHVVHQFKSIVNYNRIDESDYCQVDVNCSEGANWQDEKKGVVRLYVVITPANEAGWCTGTLVNNTANDCKKYILTAMHCSISELGIETSTYTMWKAFFDYEKIGCKTGPAPTTKVMTGAIKRAGSNDGGGSTGSDFLLIELTEKNYPAGVTPYYNGWTNSTTAPTGGVCIHHPAADCKKISTFTGTPTSTSFGIANTHWDVIWSSTTNGFGVTEPGSSGSAIFNSSGLIFGTLTGGDSYCSTPTQSDWYGKMSYHWQSNGNTVEKQLKPWLDPKNFGVTTLAGSYSCTQSVDEIAYLDRLINVYPNPSNDGIFNVSLKTESITDIKVCIYTVMGQMIENKNISNVSGNTLTQLDLSDAPAGIYFVQLTVGNQTATKKLSVSK